MVDARKELNSFQQSVAAGQIAMVTGAGPQSTTVQLNANSVATLVAARPVKLTNDVGVLPQVELAVPGTDAIYGITLFDPKIGSWTKGDILQVAGVNAGGTVVYMVAGGSLNRGSLVGINSSTFKLQAAATINNIGILLDNAVADQLVRVELLPPRAAS